MKSIKIKEKCKHIIAYNIWEVKWTLPSLQIRYEYIWGVNTCRPIHEERSMQGVLEYARLWRSTATLTWITPVKPPLCWNYTALSLPPYTHHLILLFPSSTPYTYIFLVPPHSILIPLSSKLPFLTMSSRWLRKIYTTWAGEHRPLVFWW